ncbi:MAG TPA: hypothetical protein VGO93_23465 [Candidatus Xenobia bacterium]
MHLSAEAQGHGDNHASSAHPIVAAVRGQAPPSPPSHGPSPSQRQSSEELAAANAAAPGVSQPGAQVTQQVTSGAGQARSTTDITHNGTTDHTEAVTTFAQGNLRQAFSRDPQANGSSVNTLNRLSAANPGPRTPTDSDGSHPDRTTVTQVTHTQTNATGQQTTLQKTRTYAQSTSLPRLTSSTPGAMHTALGDFPVNPGGTHRTESITVGQTADGQGHLQNGWQASSQLSLQVGDHGGTVTETQTQDNTGAKSNVTEARGVFTGRSLGTSTSVPGLGLRSDFQKRLPSGPVNVRQVQTSTPGGPTQTSFQYGDYDNPAGNGRTVTQNLTDNTLTYRNAHSDSHGVQSVDQQTDVNGSAAYQTVHATYQPDGTYTNDTTTYGANGKPQLDVNTQRKVQGVSVQSDPAADPGYRSRFLQAAGHSPVYQTSTKTTAGYGKGATSEILNQYNLNGSPVELATASGTDTQHHAVQASMLLDPSNPAGAVSLHDVAGHAHFQTGAQAPQGADSQGLASDSLMAAGDKLRTTLGHSKAAGPLALAQLIPQTWQSVSNFSTAHPQDTLGGAQSLASDVSLAAGSTQKLAGTQTGGKVLGGAQSAVDSGSELVKGAGGEVGGFLGLGLGGWELSQGQYLNGASDTVGAIGTGISTVLPEVGVPLTLTAEGVKLIEGSGGGTHALTIP